MNNAFLDIYCILLTYIPTIAYKNQLIDSINIAIHIPFFLWGFYIFYTYIHVFLTTQSKRTRCLWWLTEGDIVPWYFWSYDQQFHPVCHAVHLFVFMQAARLQRDGGAALLPQYPAGLWSWANTVLLTQNESEEWERDKQSLRAWRVKTLLWRKPQ